MTSMTLIRPTMKPSDLVLESISSGKPEMPRSEGLPEEQGGSFFFLGEKTYIFGEGVKKSRNINGSARGVMR